MQNKAIALYVLLILLGLALVVMVILFYCYIKENKKKINELEYALEHDAITGHTNWDWLWKKIGYSTEERILHYNFVHFDIKEFRLINELFGHKVGNDVLRYVGKFLDAQDFILYSARCHNDNFAFVTKQDYDGDLKLRLEKLFEDLKYIPGVEGRPLFYRCGVVEKDRIVRINDTVADLAKLAQAQGKKINCSEITIYDDAIREVVMRGETLKNELPDAIKNDHIEVYLQPKFDTVKETVIGAEALVRWNYQGKRMMYPNEFVPHLEQNNAINMLDEAVIDKVCRYIEKWAKEGMPLYPISINLSQKEIYKNNLISDIEKIVDKYSIDRGLIEFELTETAAFEDKDYMISIMKQLKEAGFKLAMDDFGTGYSSFNLLMDMPLDTLKIDKSFIDTINSNNRGKMIVEDIINMVKHLSLSCVAEGVEVESQRDLLKEWKCDSIQGYYYSKPIHIDDFERKYL